MPERRRTCVIRNVSVELERVSVIHGSDDVSGAGTGTGTLLDFLWHVDVHFAYFTGR